MAFTKMKLTTFGSSIEAKSHQGKGLHFTRVAIGDGLLGNGSMINRTQLVSERHSMRIDGIVATENSSQSAVIVTLDNGEIQEGFSYRELALFARDPDTGQEGVYLYDNAGQECEFLDTRDSGVIIYERLKLLIRVEQTDAVTFEASGNPLYLSAEDAAVLIQQHSQDKNAHPRKADLDEDGKIPAEQLPDLDYASSAHASQHASDGSDPITPAAIGAAAAPHTHDDRYYTETEMDAKLADKQDAGAAITADNIASQSVNYANGANYANNAGDADTVDGWHVNLDPYGWGIKPLAAGTGDMAAGASAFASAHVYLQFE